MKCQQTLLFLCFFIMFHSVAYAFDCEDDKTIGFILKQTQLNFDPTALRSCKVDPEHHTQTIIAYAYRDLVNDEDIVDYQLILFTINHQNLQLIDSYKVEKRFIRMGLNSDLFL